MKKVQPSGAQNREKRTRDEEDSQQTGVLDAWIKNELGTEKAHKEEFSTFL